MVRHSKERALSEREFELLLNGAQRIEKDHQSLEAQTAIAICGRLGLRVGELTHMDESWVDWRNGRIVIPRQETCTEGKNGGICASCQKNAEQQVSHFESHSVSEKQAAFFNRHIDGGFDVGDELTLSDALQLRWNTKTSAAAREVPFDFSPRIELLVERFFDAYGEWHLSDSAVGRRINKALRHADELTVSDTMPHGLRATAATYHASRGLDILSLQSVMGWADMQTARKYIRKSPDNTQKALYEAHSR